MAKYYETVHNGMQHQSLYRNLYSVTYNWINPASNRLVTTKSITTAHDEYHARARITSRGVDVRGEIKVEFIKALDEVTR